MKKIVALMLFLAAGSASAQLPAGPDTRVRITEEYARHVGRDTYFWAWPLVNIYNRRLSFVPVKDMAYTGR